MSLSDKIYVLVKSYVKRQLPSLGTDEGHTQYLQDELKEIETSIATLADASIQIAVAAPVSPRKGMVRYAISPWNPLSDGTTGLVVYNGSAWVNATGAGTSLSGLTYAQVS